MTKNPTRADIRNAQVKSGNEILYWKSLQQCRLTENEDILDKHIKSMKNPDILGHLRGARAILELLLSIPPACGGKLRKTSSLPLERCYELFLSYANVHNPKLLVNDDYYKRNFKEFICHPKYGLCIYVYKNYIVLRPDDVDLDNLFLSLYNESDTSAVKERLNLSTNLVRILDSLDSEWDRKVMKVVIGATRSRRELEVLGIRSHDIATMTDSVISTLNEADDMMETAENEVRNKLDNQILICTEKLGRMQKRKADVALDWNAMQLGELQDDIDDAKKRKVYLQEVLAADGVRQKSRFNLMRKNMLKKLVVDRKLKRRRKGGGRKRGMDEMDERYLLKMIESKSVAHGRRGDEVMYTNQRVKLRDMKKLVNHHRLSRGLAPVKSRTTVFNRSRPHNKRSRQARAHIGLGLFCAKKAPKAEDNETEITHYLRRFKANVDIHHYGTHKADSHYVLEVSSDDKAYLAPGTSTGFRGARNVKIYQSTDKSTSRKLPKYDFPTYMVNITPGTYRYLSKDFEILDGKSRKFFTSDDTYVFVRPKYFIGSPANVWASEAMVLRWEVPHKYLINLDDCFDKGCLSVLIILRDALIYYNNGTHTDDLKKLSDDTKCIHREYELNRLKPVSRSIWKAFSLAEEIGEQSRFIFDNLKLDCEELSSLLINCKSALSTNSSMEAQKIIQDVCSKCLLIVTKVKSHLPPLKTRYLESTDAGPGVSIKQHVKFRLMQRIQILDLDYFIRYHLSNGDSSMNEVERCQSYVGDALCDGKSIEWEHQKLIDVNMIDRLKKMSLEELQSAEEKRMLFNARTVCKDVASRIHGAVAPNGYMKAYTTLSTDDLFFNDKEYYDLYMSKGKNDKLLSPGGHYYASLEAFYDLHCKTAEKYVEFLKGSCEKLNGELCVYCRDHPWISPQFSRVPPPFPDKDKLPAHHYCSVEDTPVMVNGTEREVDDFQPRVQLKKRVDANQISLDDAESIDTFSSKYIVSKSLVTSALEHLQMLQIRKEKKKQHGNIEKNKEVRYEDVDWEQCIENNTLNKLPVKSLNLYLAKHDLLTDHLKLKKVEKCKFIRNHSIFKSFKASLNENDVNDDPPSDIDSDSDSSDDELLTIVGDIEDIEDIEEEREESEPEETGSDEETDRDQNHPTSDDSDNDVSNIFCTTRSGRTTRTWKASNYY